MTSVPHTPELQQVFLVPIVEQLIREEKLPDVRPVKGELVITPLQKEREKLRAFR